MIFKTMNLILTTIIDISDERDIITRIFNRKM